MCHHTSSVSPSTYFSNSHDRRDLPIPAGPLTRTRCARPVSALVWKRSFTRRSSRSRPTNGASRPDDRPSPPRLATTRRARQSRIGSVLPFSSCSPASSKAIAASAAARVDSPTRTVPGSAADCTRDAVFTRSPATMPSLVAPMVTAASPVSTPARARRSGWSSGIAATSSSAARTARSASSSVATGVPQTAITASPMNFSTVPP